MASKYSGRIFFLMRAISKFYQKLNFYIDDAFRKREPPRFATGRGVHFECSVWLCNTMERLKLHLVKNVLRSRMPLPLQGEDERDEVFLKQPPCISGEFVSHLYAGSYHERQRCALLTFLDRDLKLHH